MGKWWYYWRNKGHQTKSRVEHFRCLDCSECYDKRKYPFEEGEDVWFYGWHLNLFESHNCHYGGQRHWFLCPHPSCKRRSKKLYLCSGGGLFLCRKCLKLAYTTQNRSEADRIIDKKWHLIRKYGGDSEWTIQKPRGMHQKTFERIRNEIWRLDELATDKIAQIFGRFSLM